MTTTTDERDDKVTAINIPEAVGVFDTFETLQAAFYDLRTVGFSRYDISLLGDQKVLEEKLTGAHPISRMIREHQELPLYRKRQPVSCKVPLQAGSSSWVPSLQWLRC
jgi:hypothetical protein